MPFNVYVFPIQATFEETQKKEKSKNLSPKVSVKASNKQP
jgi:hypothetical protein